MQCSHAVKVLAVMAGKGFLRGTLPVTQQIFAKATSDFVGTTGSSSAASAAHVVPSWSHVLPLDADVPPVSFRSVPVPSRHDRHCSVPPFLVFLSFVRSSPGGLGQPVGVSAAPSRPSGCVLTSVTWMTVRSRTRRACSVPPFVHCCSSVPPFVLVHVRSYVSFRSVRLFVRLFVPAHVVRVPSTVRSMLFHRSSVPPFVPVHVRSYVGPLR